MTVTPINPTNQPYKYVFVVIGPAGSGKTTMAKAVSEKLGFEYIEGDDLHPKANIEKMSQGHPLNDNDRWGWLHNCGGACAMELDKESIKGVVLTCSALKRSYRDILRSSLEHRPAILRFIYLAASRETLIKRTTSRKNHYMKADMVESQLAILEAPTADEKDVITISVENGKEQSEEECLDIVHKMVNENKQP
ncbi:putative gluconokinase [Schizosaccharomyces pombe]|uniref:Probable gluconokinase n=1 Tax=Schizosaccharomyces pombe (strain 972 / ATCC 24843) TaxID=284812 RepID=GNTK_SCHPO|nr:gluconokinase [Schizosaccharomyces pombe]Q10242.1 RecName: Full=Probable gluconokinase; AltName: Full=Gluconate kinase [Schizosaccharomyces pombe 972h-]CAA93562.1 gluconokinase [Schizosaccharomyces pombe]|eukprot:NP_001342815.1 gluconokinase [Schizosaccharomyces pombe]